MATIKSYTHVIIPLKTASGNNVGHDRTDLLSSSRGHIHLREWEKEPLLCREHLLISSVLDILHLAAAYAQPCMPRHR